MSSQLWALCLRLPRIDTQVTAICCAVYSTSWGLYKVCSLPCVRLCAQKCNIQSTVSKASQLCRPAARLGVAGGMLVLLCRGGNGGGCHQIIAPSTIEAGNVFIIPAMMTTPMITPRIRRCRTNRIIGNIYKSKLSGWRQPTALLLLLGSHRTNWELDTTTRS